MRSRAATRAPDRLAARGLPGPRITAGGGSSRRHSPNSKQMTHATFLTGVRLDR
jgi:hypothetical protein